MFQFETRDPKTGDIVRYNADDDEITLGEMLRQERFGAGISDQKSLDAQYAKALMGDGKFEVRPHHCLTPSLPLIALSE